MIDKNLKRANDITKKKMLCKDKDDESEYPLIIRANNNMMKSEIKCAYQINFIILHNIVSMLKFLSKCIMEFFQLTLRGFVIIHHFRDNGTNRTYR